MAIDIAEAHVTDSSTSQTAPAAEQPLVCSLTGRSITPAETYWAPPLVTARELVAAVVATVVRAPGNLGHILFAEQPDVPYAQDVRDQLAARRSAEQLKLLVGLLIAAALIAVPILMLALR
jgi:hypothetical protein